MWSGWRTWVTAADALWWLSHILGTIVNNSISISGRMEILFMNVKPVQISQICGIARQFKVACKTHVLWVLHLWFEKRCAEFSRQWFQLHHLHPYPVGLVLPENWRKDTVWSQCCEGTISVAYCRKYEADISMWVVWHAIYMLWSRFEVLEEIWRMHE